MSTDNNRGQLVNQPSVNQILGSQNFKLVRNYDETYRISHRRPNDKPVALYNGLHNALSMPAVKITKKKEENDKMEKMLAYLQPISNREEEEVKIVIKN